MEKFIEWKEYVLSRKKGILIGLVLLILLGAVLGFYFFFLSKNGYQKNNEKMVMNTEIVVDKKEEPEKKKEPEVIFSSEETKQEVVVDVLVDIKGEVKKPGVYQVNPNSRVQDVIQLAGGVTKNADTTIINLGKKVFDEMVIIVYTKPVKISSNSTASLGKEPAKQENKKEDMVVETKEEKETIKKEEEKNTLKEKPIVEEIKEEVKKEDIITEIKDCPTKTDILNDACVTQEDIDGKEENVSTDKPDSNLETEKLISINRATKEELMSITGIGTSKADKIIAYREENGSFEKLEDLMNVSGIGESLFEKIKPYITL